MKRIIYLLFVFSQLHASAQFVFDNNEDQPTKTAVQPPLETTNISFQKITVKAEEPSNIQFPSGTRIKIPTNAFVDLEGNIVEGEVDIDFREFTNPLDIYLSGIPMTIEQNGKKEVFQSAGMIEIRASQDEKEIFPNPDSEMITVEMTSNQLEDDFQLYALNESTGEWIEEGKDEVLWNSKDIIPDIPINVTPSNNNQSINLDIFRPPVSPSLDLAYVSFSILKYGKNVQRYLKKIEKHKNKLQFKIASYGGGKNANKDSKNLVKNFPELRFFRKTTWIYDGKNKREAAKFLIKLNKRNVNGRAIPDSLNRFDLKNFTIRPNHEDDNFNLEFTFRDTVVTLQAYPYFSSSNPNVIQKDFKNFYKKYSKKYKERCVNWKHLEKKYNNALTDYEVEFAAYQKMVLEKDILGLLTTQQLASGVTRREISVFTFGILNVDKVMNRLDENLLVEFVDKNNKKVDYLKVVVFDKKNNATLSYLPENKVRFDSDSQNSLMIVLENSAGAIVTAKEFQEGYFYRKEGKMIFKITPFEKEEFNKQKLSDALASN